LPRALDPSGGDHIDGLKPLLTLRDFHRDFLSFLQGFESLSLDGAVVHEHILPAFLFDKAESLAVIEPFDRSRYPLTRHDFSFPGSDLSGFALLKSG